MRIISLSIFAAGMLWALGQHPASAASVNDVLGACDRTPGCGYSQNKNGDISGCSKNACFYCPADGSRQCTGVSKARTGGSKGKGQVDIGGVKLDRASNSSKTAKAIRAHQAGQTTTSSDVGKTKSKSGQSGTSPKSKIERASSNQMQRSSGSNKKH